jgi:hypothetical protein
MSNLAIIEEILHSRYKPMEQNFLIEENKDGKKQAFEMKYKIVKRPGIYHHLFRYEEDALPFFDTGISGLKKMCDFILFAEDEREILYVFLIELKLGTDSAMKQLNAAKEFVQFIINSALRVGKEISDYKIRKIRISDEKVQNYVSQKPKSKAKTNIGSKVEAYFIFDENDYCEYRLKDFKLTALIEHI